MAAKAKQTATWQSGAARKWHQSACGMLAKSASAAA